MQQAGKLRRSGETRRGAARAPFRRWPSYSAPALIARRVSHPSRVRLGRHARDRCLDYDRSPAEIADLVLANHRRRRRNPGSADWLLTARGLVVAYNWPDRDDPTTAHVVTLWPEQ
jgi:hypothetical protein